jgi:molybdenum cofactor cytidylyltransferase
VRTAAIILAAGGASRFGAPKQLAQLDGAALLQHVVDAARAVPLLEDIVVVLGANADAIEARVDLAPARTVRCASWPDGLSASLRAGVAALDEGVDCALVLLGDQPRVTPQVIALVVDGAAASGVRAARASYGGVGGHPVALRRALLQRVPELTGDAGMRDLLVGPGVRLLEAGHLCDPADVDTPQDLQALEGTR